MIYYPPACKIYGTRALLPYAVRTDGRTDRHTDGGQTEELIGAPGGLVS